MTVVITTSHRSREKLFRIVGSPSPGFYAYGKDGRISGNDYYEVPDALADVVLAIKGVREVKNPPELHKRWSGNGPG